MTTSDRFFIGVGSALFALFLALFVCAGAQLSSSREPFQRPPYAAWRMIPVDGGWARGMTGKAPREPSKTHSRLGDCRPGRAVRRKR